MVQLNKKKELSKPGALAPLFDRLMDLEPSLTQELDPFAPLNAVQLQESITHELSLVLNTRPTAKRLADEDIPDSISDYCLPTFFGLADFSWFDAGQDFYLHKIVRLLEEVIRHYEPRLMNPKIKVRERDRAILGLHVDISGTIDPGDGVRQVNFPLSIANLFTR